MNWTIYTLKNPRTDEVRYVGWTSQYARAGELAELAPLVEGIQAEAASIEEWQEHDPDYGSDRLRAIVGTMNSVVRSELRKLQRGMEFPQ